LPPPPPPSPPSRAAHAHAHAAAAAAAARPLAPLLSGPNVLIVSMAAGLTLPVAAAQAVAALFSRVITQLRYAESAMARFFAASVPVSAACAGVALGRDAPPANLGAGGGGEVAAAAAAAEAASGGIAPGVVSPADCAACAFPVFSTLVSALFALLYCLWLMSAARRLARDALNARLARRAALGLGGLLPLLLCLGVTLRGVSVFFFPYTLAHDAALLAYALCVCAAVTCASAVAAWLPLREAVRAERESCGGGGRGGGGGGGGGGGRRPLLASGGGGGGGGRASSTAV
jgi:hypothetical protein